MVATIATGLDGQAGSDIKGWLSKVPTNETNNRIIGYRRGAPVGRNIF